MIDLDDTDRAILRALAEDGRLSAGELGRRLGLSQPAAWRRVRRLEEAGTSFREVSDRLRAQAAQRLLHEQGLTVAEAGRQLGFSDARAFWRAFKRWLGQVPGEVRRAGNGG